MRDEFPRQMAERKDTAASPLRTKWKIFKRSQLATDHCWRFALAQVLGVPRAVLDKVWQKLSKVVDSTDMDNVVVKGYHLSNSPP